MCVPVRPSLLCTDNDRLHCTTFPSTFLMVPTIPPPHLPVSSSISLFVSRWNTSTLTSAKSNHPPEWSWGWVSSAAAWTCCGREWQHTLTSASALPRTCMCVSVRKRKRTSKCVCTYYLHMYVFICRVGGEGKHENCNYHIPRNF